MHRILGVGCFAALAFVISGCGGGSAESVLKEQIDTMNAMADAMKNKDEARVKELDAKGKELGEKFGKFSADEQKAAVEKHKSELMAATQKVMAASMGMMGDLFKQGMGDLKAAMPDPSKMKIEFKVPGQ